jgi:hypothetical protein
MNNFSANVEKIFETLRQFEPKLNLKKQIRQPKMSDLELIAIDLTAEYMSIDSERQLFRILPQAISSRIERSVYNKRRRALFDEKQRLQQLMAQRITGAESCFLIDSMPLEICKLSRASRSKICKENEQAFPDKGFCASQSMYYYGYKLHAACSVTGVFTSFDLSAASVHDIHYLKDIKQTFESCVILGDKGYLSADYQLDLFTSNRISLEVPMRSNQLQYKPYPAIFKKSRKRIETLFSQLCDQFMIRRNYAKTFEGFKTRILSKITALTVIQLINKLLNRNINNLKICIA